MQVCDFLKNRLAFISLQGVPNRIEYFYHFIRFSPYCFYADQFLAVGIKLEKPSFMISLQEFSINWVKAKMRHPFCRLDSILIMLLPMVWELLGCSNISSTNLIAIYNCPVSGLYSSRARSDWSKWVGLIIQLSEWVAGGKPVSCSQWDWW